MQEPTPRRILVPLDGSANSEAALPIAGAIVRASGATLVLLRVSQVHLDPAPRPVDEGLAAVHDAERYLAEVRRRLLAEGLGQVTPTVWCGSPASAILEAATRHQVDLIVMTTRARTEREQDMFGSVARSVLHAADVPVLVLRAGGDVASPSAPRSRA